MFSLTTSRNRRDGNHLVFLFTATFTLSYHLWEGSGEHSQYGKSYTRICEERLPARPLGLPSLIFDHGDTHCTAHLCLNDSVHRGAWIYENRAEEKSEGNDSRRRPVTSRAVEEGETAPRRRDHLFSKPFTPGLFLNNINRYTTRRY